ncbi:hypothetical protein AB0I02_41370 [Streptomyces phaeochromogenes]
MLATRLPLTLVVAAAFPALRHARLTASSDEASANATDGDGNAHAETPTKGSAR